MNDHPQEPPKNTTLTKAEVEFSKRAGQGKRKTPKPPRTKAQRSFVFPIEILDAIQALSEHYDVPVSKIVQRMCEDGIRRYDVPELNLVKLCNLHAKYNPFDELYQEQRARPKLPESAYVPDVQYGAWESVDSTPTVPPSAIIGLPAGVSVT